MPEKMNLVIKNVILEKWKSKIGYSFNYKDLDELEVIISQFNNHIEYLQEQLKHKQNIINNILDYIDSNKFVEQFENVVNERNVRNEILNRIEESDK